MRLRTPEEVSDDLDGKIKVATIRRHCRDGNVDYVAGDRGKFLLTDSQVDSLVAYLTRPAKAVASKRGGADFGSSGRSRALRQKKS